MGLPTLTPAPGRLFHKPRRSAPPPQLSAPFALAIAVRTPSLVAFMRDALLLWDIDGTLTRSSGAGLHALETALRLELGVTASLADIDYSGRTDRWILRQIFAKFGFAADDAAFTRYLDAYIRALPASLVSHQSHVLPGVSEALERVHTHDRWAQALLTGNVERGARVKLAHHDLARYFPFGAFADDSELRNDLGPVALRRARDFHGVDFPAHRVIVIGDTPHDIACGRIIGAQTVAVATGLHSLAELQSHQPTAAFASLADPGFAALLNAL